MSATLDAIGGIELPRWLSDSRCARRPARARRPLRPGPLARRRRGCLHERGDRAGALLPAWGWRDSAGGTRNRAASDVRARAGACRTPRFARRACARRGDSELGGGVESSSRRTLPRPPSRSPASRRSSTPGCTKCRATTRSVRSIVWRRSALRAMPRISAPAALPELGPALRSACGTRPIGCGRIASRKSSASTCRRRFSTCWPGEAIPVRSTGLPRRAPIVSNQHSSCWSGWERRVQRS